ncbi:Leucine-rich repeat domain superfamily, partial [Sesbania bispinosa]
MVGRLPNLEGLLKVEVREIFLCLSNVTIRYCPKLRWPCLLSVKYLNVEGCKSELLKSITSMSSVTTLYLEDGLRSLPDGIQHLPSLDKLEFSVCGALESLPEQGWEGLRSEPHFELSRFVNVEDWDPCMM